jgi:ribonuclease BN (tRNA processing enzyme)
MVDAWHWWADSLLIEVDSMEQPTLKVLGSGNAFNDDGRGCQSIFIDWGIAATMLVDLGPTALCSMDRFDIRTDDVDLLFFTHLHGDHTAGWPFLLLHLALKDHRRRPLEIFGPVGTRECLEGLVQLCYAEIVEKVAFDIHYHELPVARNTNVEVLPGLTVDSFPMTHHPTSLGYRFNKDGFKLGVSGDTAWCEDLERLTCGTQLSVLECTSVESLGVAHLCLDEIRSHVERLGAGQILLVHLTDEVAADLGRDPIARVIASHDGFSFPPSM